MKIKYIMTQNTYFDCEDGRISYGIAAMARERGVDTVIEQFNDMSSDKEKILALIKICNKKKLSLIHLSDVAEDFVLS